MSTEKSFPYIAPVTCVKCSKELKPLEPSQDPYGMVDGGVVGKLFSPYGSENDGTVFQIGICDECIKKVKLTPIGDYMDSGMDTEIKHKAKIEDFKATGTYITGECTCLSEKREHSRPIQI